MGAGGKLTLLHEIFQRTGRTPDEIMNKPEGVQKFAFISMKEQIERENKEKEAIKRINRS